MTLLILLYLIGTALSYGRNLASFYETYKDNKWLFNNEWESFQSQLIRITLMSWVGFILGTITYFAEKETIFLKFNLEED